MMAGNRTLFRLSVGITAGKARVVWRRPSDFEIDGDAFDHVTGPAIVRSRKASR